MDFAGQQAQADSQLEYQTKLVEQRNEYTLQNARAANDAYIDEAAAENNRIAQTDQQAADQIEQAQDETLQAAGASIASSEGAGLGQVIDVFRQFGGYRSNLETNLKFERAQSDLNKRGLRAKAQSRANSVQPYTPQPVTFPSPAAAAINFAGQALGTYNKFKPQ